MQGPETRLSLLARLADPADHQAWSEFDVIYRPLIYRVARAKGLQHADADDLTQEVLTAVGRAIDSFDPVAGGSFRSWLYQITRNLAINHLTRRRDPPGSGDTDVQRMLLQQPERIDDQTESLFQLEYRRSLFQHAASRVQPQFSEPTWRAFWLTAVEQRPIEEVAKALNKSPGAVRVARCRVLARLRTEVANITGHDDQPIDM